MCIFAPITKSDYSRRLSMCTKKPFQRICGKLSPFLGRGVICLRYCHASSHRRDGGLPETKRFHHRIKVCWINMDVDYVLVDKIWELNNQIFQIITGRLIILNHKPYSSIVIGWCVYRRYMGVSRVAGFWQLAPHKDVEMNHTTVFHEFFSPQMVLCWGKSRTPDHFREI